MKKPGRQYSENVKKLIFYLIISPVFFLFCVNTIHADTLISAGYYHTVALKQDGTVWAWGGNGYGQLGNGTTIDRHTPGLVSSLSGVAAIAAGEVHTVALKQNGTVWAWGWNWSGQLGDGTQT